MRTALIGILIGLAFTAGCRSIEFTSSESGDLYIARQSSAGGVATLRHKGPIEKDEARKLSAWGGASIRIAVLTDDDRIAYLMPQRSGQFRLSHFRAMTEIDHTILRGSIQTRMTTHDVVLSWGHPFRSSMDSESVYAFGRLNTWRYWGASEYYLHFQNDVLTGWDKY